MGIGSTLGRGARFLYDEKKEQDRLEREAEERRVRIEGQKLQNELARSKVQHQAMVQAITSSNGENHAMARALSDHHPGEWDFMVDQASVDPDTGASGFLIGKYRRNKEDTGYQRDPKTGDRIFDKRLDTNGNPMKLQFSNNEEKMLWGATMSNPDLYGALAIKKMQDKQAIETEKLKSDIGVTAAVKTAEKTGVTELREAQTGVAAATEADIKEQTRLREKAIQARGKVTGKKPAATYTDIGGNEVDVSEIEAKQAGEMAKRLTDDYGVTVSPGQAFRIAQIQSNKKMPSGTTYAQAFRKDMKDVADEKKTLESLRELYVGRLGIPGPAFDQLVEQVEGAPKEEKKGLIRKFFSLINPFD